MNEIITTCGVNRLKSYLLACCTSYLMVPCLSSVCVSVCVCVCVCVCLGGVGS